MLHHISFTHPEPAVVTAPQKPESATRAIHPPHSIRFRKLKAYTRVEYTSLLPPNSLSERDQTIPVATLHKPSSTKNYTASVSSPSCRCFVTSWGVFAWVLWFTDFRSPFPQPSSNTPVASAQQSHRNYLSINVSDKGTCPIIRHLFLVGSFLDISGEICQTRNELYSHASSH